MGIRQDHARLAVEFTAGQIIRISYRNWQGKVSTRTVRVIRLTYGATEWHPELQWLLEAFDLEKGAVRLFALQDMAPAS